MNKRQRLLPSERCFEHGKKKHPKNILREFLLVKSQQRELEALKRFRAFASHFPSPAHSSSSPTLFLDNTRPNTRLLPLG